MEFTEFNLNPDIQAGIKALGYTTPTPIQEQAIPAILQGRDILGMAHTGTGKTAAFLLPILEKLMTGPRKQVRALIIAPTRELAAQTHEFVIKLGRRTRLKAVTIYGGVNKNPQITKLRSGVEIVTACPGRLIDLMDQGVVDLSRLEILVLDESDRMLDMGFLPDIREIISRIPAQRQTLLFSATMPDDMQVLAQDILVDPVSVAVDTGAPVSTVSHALYPVQQHLKTSLLMKLLDCTDTKSVLVFTRTKDRATRVARQLKKANYDVVCLQGDLSQGKRKEALDGFRKGKYRILVATDIAARGIDISLISHVINYDMPDTVDAYTHRIGRTGRATRSGDAFTFVTSEDRGFVWDIERALGEKLERRILQDFDYTVPSPRGAEDRDGSSSFGRRSGARSSSPRTGGRASAPSLASFPGLRNRQSVGTSPSASRLRSRRGR